MPISAPSMGDDEESRDPRFQSDEMYDVDELEVPGLTPTQAELLLRQLGGGVVEKERLLEAIGWKARIESAEDGVVVHFQAHDELIDDLIRRFELLAEKAVR